MLTIAFLVFARASTISTAWSSTFFLALACALVPWFQWATGQVAYAGVAWMSSLFLLGFALVLRVGAVWENASPGQPIMLLFGAIVFSALVSTGLAMTQWLQLDLDIWVMETGGTRPYANLAQPNQLATFLSWGLIGLTWLWGKRHIGVTGWCIGSAFILFGIALTSSRTAWLILFMLVILLKYWRSYFHQRQLFFAGLFFSACFIASNWAIPIINAEIENSSVGGVALETLQARLASEARPTIWLGYLDAISRRPWAGYGWTQGGLAQIAVLLDHPNWTFFASHSHNLFLDLVTWMGIPAGVAVSGFLVWRMWRLFRSVESVDQAMLFCLVGAVGIHAMLELPLHYLHFLLPAGLAWGILEARQSGISLPWLGRLPILSSCLLVSFVTGAVIRDYLNVQTSYQWLRYEWAGLATKGSTPTPEVLILTQWSDFFILSHRELTQPVNTEELRRIENLAHLYPSAGFLMQLAAAQSMHKNINAAEISLRQACQLYGNSQCDAIRTKWAHAALDEPALTHVDWTQMKLGVKSP